MVVTCPECGTQYAFPEERLKPGGVKVRCSRCGQVFRLAPEEEGGGPEIPLSATTPEAPASLGESPPPKAGPELPGDGVPEKTAIPEEETTPAAEGKPEALPSPRRWRRAGVAVLLVVLLAGGLGGLAWWQTRGEPRAWWSALKGWWPSRKPPASRPPPGQPESVGSAQEVVRLPPPPTPAPDLRELPITWVKARYRGLVNAKGGQLLVIQGEVANQGKAPRGPVRVKATLTDAQHRPLREEVVYGGTTFSDQELVTLTPKEIQEWLNQPGGRVKVRLIPPGETQPFTVVFFGVPDNLAEIHAGFQVSVVEGPKTTNSP